MCGDIAVANGLIAGVGKYDGKTEIDVSGKLVLPGFIDAHIHLESSMVTPAEFAKAVVPTVQPQSSSAPLSSISVATGAGNSENCIVPLPTSGTVILCDLPRNAKYGIY